MDIHKPKPWHGLREFLKEYAIIVVGVLTALGAEQAVEVIHRHEAVAEARRALNAPEVTFDLAVFDLRRFKVGLHRPPSWTRSAERWLRSWDAGSPCRSRPLSHLPRTTNYRTAVFHVASCRALVQMPFGQVAYGHLYDAFENNLIIRREGWRDLWGDIDEHVSAIIQRRISGCIAADIRPAHRQRGDPDATGRKYPPSRRPRWAKARLPRRRLRIARWLQVSARAVLGFEPRVRFLPIPTITGSAFRRSQGSPFIAYSPRSCYPGSSM